MPEVSKTQPLLPQVRLIWSFVAVTLAAVLLALVRAADQSTALISAVVGISLWIGLVFFMFSVLFLITWALGVLENLLASPEVEVMSPFAVDRLPDQIVVPNTSEAQ
jgi:hypothetical protein